MTFERLQQIASQLSHGDGFVTLRTANPVRGHKVRPEPTRVIDLVQFADASASDHSLASFNC
jgi:hypothetical protein